MPGSAAVEVTDLVVRYGRRTALDGVSLTLAAGEVSAVLGPNGAGKTTLVETCEGYRTGYAGTVRVLGAPPTDRGLRARVGVMLQEGGVWPALGAARAVQQIAALHRDPLPVADLLERLDLGAVARTPFRRLSGGEKQRVKLAIALVGRPELVVLDEPTAGMDPHARLAVWDLIRELRADGVSLLLTTHLLDEAEALADLVVILARGTVLTTGHPRELTAGGDEVVFRPVAAAGADVDVVDLTGLGTMLPGATVTRDRLGRVSVSGPLDSGELVAGVVHWCDREGLRAEGIEVRHRTLEAVYLEATRREVAG